MPHAIVPHVFVRSISYLLALALVCITGTMALAQQPKLEMHRTAVSADDGSGWHLAVSTKGSFSVRMPIPFNDFTVVDPSTGEATHAIGGTSSERIKFMAAEMPVTPRTPADLGTIPQSFSSNKANTVSDISRQTKDGVETLSFSIAGPASSAHFRYIKMKSALYMLSIEFPKEQSATVATIKDEFFGSFSPKAKP